MHVDDHGDAYIANIGFDFAAGFEPTDGTHPGTLAHVAPDGTARTVADDLAFPNGITVTPDRTTLIVAESHRNRLTAYTITPDHSLTERRTWADLGDGCPDGIWLDPHGAVWYADVPNRRCVRVLEGGTVTDTIDADRGCFACVLGGPDQQTLYIVAARFPEAMTSDERTGVILAADLLQTAAQTAGR